MSLTIAIIKETKHPIDLRTPLTPEQCNIVKQKFPGVNIVVQSCTGRCFSDDDYRHENIEVYADVSFADIFLGVKEVAPDKLIANKTYLFFSHTIKKQPHNKNLLRTVLQKNICLIDYETLLWEAGNRIIGFGRFAGIVGAHYAFVMIGKRFGLYHLKHASACKDIKEMYNQYEHITLPALKIALCGDGRVAHGCIEMFRKLKIHQVSKEDFFNQTYTHMVFVHLRNEDFYEHNDGREWDKSDFYKHPEDYHSSFKPFYQTADVMINAVFWRAGNPIFFTKEQMKGSDFKIKIISDISCDIPGSLPSTIKSTTIDNPFYGFNVYTEKESTPFLNNVIDIQAVGNLPCELPVDASLEFGENLIRHVLPCIIESDQDRIIEFATIAKEGNLMPRYQYLADYVS